MGQVARNSIKGYTYQQSIFVLFLALMDAERKIFKIEVESLDTKNFDDIYVECMPKEGQQGLSYRIQVKNYPDTVLDDIVIVKNNMSIKGNRNEFVPGDNNILIVNTKSISTNDVFMGLPCTKINNITIIPFTTDQVADKMDNMFNTEARELQIIHEADDITENAKFVITIDELPEIIQMSTDLENKTVLLRKVPDDFEHNITFIEGKPGVGKSHFVNEICDKYPNAVVYRFWTGSQDPNKNRRIQFEIFISEIGIKVYKTAKKVYIEELIDTIEKEDKIIIIDGLDHVENYNPQQLEEFIEFIDKITNTRVIVLSRPLKYEVKWKKENLLDWTFDETRLYLEMAHEIFDYKVQNQMFYVSGGYPIITYFLGEDYKLNHRVAIDQPIAGINEYYDTLFINDEKPSSAILVFASGNCFFTWKELESFFVDPEMYEVICEFIEMHPYLFKVIMNRVSLIHDSFNTYLRVKIKNFSKRQGKTISIIRDSILNGSVEYMARMQSFDFDDEFYELMLKKYADAEEFKNLMMSTRDYNSIQSLYVQLQRILEDRKGVLDICQYYSFALLFQIANRNDLIGTDSMVFQMLLYMNGHGGIEDNIFSSDYIWQVYLSCRHLEKLTAQYLTNRHISDSQFYDLIDHINEDYIFFEKKNTVIKYDNLEKQFKNKKYGMIENKKALSDYFISVWVNGKIGDKFYDSFTKYVEGDKECINNIEVELLPYGFNRFWIDSSLSVAEYKLHELGYLGEHNKFRNVSLYDLIMKNAKEGSYRVVRLAASYLKLANYEKREVDISSLGYCWSMYFERKDYSVFTIDNALITFEEEKLIQENESFEILFRLMQQSEKGISGLFTSYVNKKGIKFIKRFIENKYFERYNSQIRFWELNSENLDCFSKKEMAKRITELLSIHYYSKTIEGIDIQNVMESKYMDMFLDGIEYYGYSILSPNYNLIPKLEERNIKCIGTEEKGKEEYVPLQDGCIHECDFQYISKQKLGHLEIAQYTDGWYSCLPFVDVFSICKREDIQKDCVEIIYRAMFARAAKREYLGNWNLLIGNIPAFIQQYEIDVDWGKLYTIFNNFLDLSLIYRGK